MTLFFSFVSEKLASMPSPFPVKACVISTHGLLDEDVYFCLLSSVLSGMKLPWAVDDWRSILLYEVRRFRVFASDLCEM